MNMNHHYGPSYPSQRRHDGGAGFVAMPPHMRPHPGYQQFYPQHMGPMMAPYPPPYAQNWYQYPQHHMQQPLPAHAPRGAHYYPPPGPPMPHPPHFQSPHAVSPHSVGRSSPRPMHPAHPPFSQQSSAVPTTASTPARASPSPQSSTKSVTAPPPEEEIRQASPATTSSQAQESDVRSERLIDDEPFHPPVPWLSVEDESFPKRALRRKRRIARSKLASEPVEYPLDLATPVDTPISVTPEQRGNSEGDQEVTKVQELPSLDTSLENRTPVTSDVPSEGGSTQPTSPSSAVPTVSITQQAPTQPKTQRPVAPVLPAMPVLPQTPISGRNAHRDSGLSVESQISDNQKAQESPRRGSTTSTSATEEHPSSSTEATAKNVSAPAPPKSWADLVRSKAAPSSGQTSTSTAQLANGLNVPKSGSLAEVLSEMNSSGTSAQSKIAFLQPRGLVNTGNICYMNSVLQMLVFCVPFYNFLDQVSRRAAHVFKSETPMIDAMIMFKSEYPIIDSAGSVEQLKLRLKPEDFEKYGDPFIPEYVYQVIRQLPRFRDMRRGHQQDAQEFLGFLLEELHEECAHAMRTGASGGSGRSTPVGIATSETLDNEGGWMEVGHKQKPAITRSSGTTSTETPITNIFGGKLRSELKVPGNKISVTLEPYQPLQLDIGSPQINNIVEALKGLTRPESMQGDFLSARGTKASATKQVFIESLPPVLILHLKRFHYDNTTKRTEKIWKKVGYPLELEIPKEVFPPQTRNKLATHGSLPRYRLIGVIYHHGRNANGGHYTVDIRRQDGVEWIRLDDTLIRRVRHEDVAEGGSEEDPKVLAAALERHKQQKVNPNRFEQFDDEIEVEEESEKAWNQVNGHSRSKSTMSTVVNGASTPTKDSSGLQTPNAKFSIKDNKVAYLLFYHRLSN